MTVGLTFAPAPAVATVRQESRSAPGPAVATVPQQRAFSVPSSLAVRSHNDAADYLTQYTGHSSFNLNGIVHCVRLGSGEK